MSHDDEADAWAFWIARPDSSIPSIMLAFADRAYEAGQRDMQERCARVADVSLTASFPDFDEGYELACSDIAAAICALPVTAAGER